MGGGGGGGLKMGGGGRGIGLDSTQLKQFQKP